MAANILARDLKPPQFDRPMGIVTTGEGRYEPGIVIMVRLLREELGCKLPVKIFHKRPWKTCMDGLDVELVNTTDLQATHPALSYGGWQSKSYAVLHSGFQRVLFLDADAYCVADPTPLFRLLDTHSYVYWADWGPGGACAPIPNELASHNNGGEYLVDLAKFWKQYQAIRFLDNYSHIFYRHNVIGDECSTRLVRSLVKDEGVFRADWAQHARGVGILCKHQGTTYIAHRMGKKAKFFLDTVPRSNPKWPFEQRVLEMFAELSPDYVARKETERASRTPKALRAERQRVVERRGKPCTRTKSPALAR
jgi:hypothetical protein